MNLQEVVTGLLSVMAVAGGWFMREMWGAVKQLQADQQTFEVHVHERFSKKDDVREMFNDLQASLRRIEDKLDTKADR